MECDEVIRIMEESLPTHAPELPPEFLQAARDRFARFLADNKGDFAVLCHSDADGLASGAIITRALLTHGRKVVPLTTGKGGSAWSEESRATLTQAGTGAIIVCDLGLRGDPIVPGRPTFFIDHHRPASQPADAVTSVVTGYGLEPTPTTGLLALECAAALTPDLLSDLDWIAAISILSDIGDKSAFGMVAAAKKKYGAGVLREATSMLNAPRRTASGDASGALALLVSAAGPKEISAGTSDASLALQRAREEVKVAYDEAKKASPRFAGPVAAIRIHTPCQVHPLIAQIWRTRLPKLIVMGVNTGFRPGWVHFSCRCGKGTNLLDFLRANRPDGADDQSYGQGHDQAGGGALPVAVWNEFARKIGFGDDMQVTDDPAAVAPAAAGDQQLDFIPS